MATISGEVRDENNDLLADCVVRAYRRDTGAPLVAGLSGDGSEETVGDTDYDSVLLLMHCDGADGSTTFTDESPTPKTVTAYGGALIETDQSKFGGASAYFDGNNDYLLVTGITGGLGNADFTIEMWCNTTTTAAGYANLYYLGSGVGSLSRYSNTIVWYQDGALRCASSPIATNTWYHIAVVRSSGVVTLYLNGVSQGTYSTTVNFTNTTHTIGSVQAGTSEFFSGYLDDIRVTKGVARYTSGFTPPTAALIGGTIPAKPLGEYTLTTAYTGEVQVIALDPDGGTTFNDLILRTTPV